MRLKVIAKLLIPGAVLLLAGAASGQDPEPVLVQGVFAALDSRNISVDTEACVLCGDVFNEIEVDGVCTASTGERVRFEFVTTAIDKSNISDKSANLDQKNKSNPAVVVGIINGVCDGDILFDLDPCFDDFECGLGTCIGDPPRLVAEPLLCDKVRVITRITPGMVTNFRADASKCTTVSAPLVAAVEVACGGRDNRGITVSATNAGELRRIRISGRGDTIGGVLLNPDAICGLCDLARADRLECEAAAEVCSELFDPILGLACFVELFDTVETKCEEL